MHKNLILHLTLIENIGPAVIQKIKERFLLRQGFEGQAGISVSDLYSSSPTDWMHTFGFSQSTSEKLVDGLANTRILETELALIEQNNIQWVTFEDELYPQLLKNIYLPPAVLYYQGSFSSGHPDPSIHPTGTQGERSKLLAVVGARKADEYGYRIVNQLIPELVAANYTIVSGGALGIDAAAHAATIKSGGTTIAVLGSGLLLPYPSSNKKLFESIVANGGCLMSSFP